MITQEVRQRLQTRLTQLVEETRRSSRGGLKRSRRWYDVPVARDHEPLPVTLHAQALKACLRRGHSTRLSGGRLVFRAFSEDLQRGARSEGHRDYIQAFAPFASPFYDGGDLWLELRRRQDVLDVEDLSSSNRAKIQEAIGRVEDHHRQAGTLDHVRQGMPLDEEACSVLWNMHYRTWDAERMVKRYLVGKHNYVPQSDDALRVSDEALLTHLPMGQRDQGHRTRPTFTYVSRRAGDRQTEVLGLHLLPSKARQAATILSGSNEWDMTACHQHLLQRFVEDRLGLPRRVVAAHGELLEMLIPVVGKEDAKRLIHACMNQTQLTLNHETQLLWRTVVKHGITSLDVPWFRKLIDFKALCRDLLIRLLILRSEDGSTEKECDEALLTHSLKVQAWEMSSDHRIGCEGSLALRQLERALLTTATQALEGRGISVYLLQFDGLTSSASNMTLADQQRILEEATGVPWRCKMSCLTHRISGGDIVPR
jgi:hypothetical protein